MPTSNVALKFVEYVLRTKFNEKILKGSQELEKHTLKQLVQKYSKMVPSREVNDLNKNILL